LSDLRSSWAESGKEPREEKRIGGLADALREAAPGFGIGSHWVAA